MTSYTLVGRVQELLTPPAGAAEGYPYFVKCEVLGGPKPLFVGFLVPDGVKPPMPGEEVRIEASWGY